MSKIKFSKMYVQLYFCDYAYTTTFDIREQSSSSTIYMYRSKSILILELTKNWKKKVHSVWLEYWLIWCNNKKATKNTKATTRICTSRNYRKFVRFYKFDHCLPTWQTCKHWQTWQTLANFAKFAKLSVTTRSQYASLLMNWKHMM